MTSRFAFRSAFSPSRRRLRAGAVMVAAGLLAGLVPGGPAPDAVAYPTSTVKLEGHGWGHGRGMGQYGALGYAIDHDRGWRWILGHFYGNTSEGTISNSFLRVRLTAFDSRDTIAYSPGRLKTNHTGSNTYRALLVRRESGAGNTHTYDIWKGADCGGGTGWQKIRNNVSGEVDIQPASSGAQNFVQACEPAGTRRAYRGTLVATKDSEGPQRTVNRVRIEDYLRGVVPRESPASWGSADGGRGMHALRAQAVAARSYAASENRYSYGQTCDTISCQVYRGYWDSAFGLLEHSNTNQAIADTRNVVRRRGGAVMRSEFSSSTGGWTTGPTFPNVVDDGDDTASNPNHTWRAEIAVSTIQAAYPTLGTLRDVNVTKRNGLGDWGGRALEVKLVGSSRTVTLTGDAFRSRFGLKSDWFRVLGGSDISERRGGYWAVNGRGGVFSRGNGVPFHGAANRLDVPGSIVAAAAHPDRGYYLVSDRGAVYAFGAPYRGNAVGRSNHPIVDIEVRPNGAGYALVNAKGRVFKFGRFPLDGRLRRLRNPRGDVVEMMFHNPSDGYYLVTDTGRVYARGGAPNRGYTQVRRNVTDAMQQVQGKGYALVTAGGRIFRYGQFPDKGSLRHVDQVGRVVTAEARPRGGYYLFTDRGRVYAFGAPFFGSFGKWEPPRMTDFMLWPRGATGAP